MKKNHSTRTQRRNERARTNIGAKWSPIWRGGAKWSPIWRGFIGKSEIPLEGEPNKAERESLVEFARGLHRSQPAPGWHWTQANAANAHRNPRSRFVRRAGIGRE